MFRWEGAARAVSFYSQDSCAQCKVLKEVLWDLGNPLRINAPMRVSLHASISFQSWCIKEEYAIHDDNSSFLEILHEFVSLLET